MTTLFQQAVDLLEENLDFDSDDDALPTRGQPPKKVEGSHSEGVGQTATGVSPGHSPDVTQHNPVARPLPNKALIGTRETKDYSSPRGNVRSLGREHECHASTWRFIVELAF